MINSSSDYVFKTYGVGVIIKPLLLIEMILLNLNTNSKELIVLKPI